MTKEVSNVKFTDLGYLREQVIKRLKETPEERWTDQEINVIVWLAGFDSGLQLIRDKLNPGNFPLEEEPLILVSERDIQQFELPKWVTLTSWLAPEGLANTHPEFVANVAKYALRIQPDSFNLERRIPPHFLKY